ncbi:MAG: hypothetical protein ACXWNK_16325 [Vulcanimicrobiaceae bacterium]
MAVDFAEYVSKLQEQSLSAVKQAQDVNLAALASWRQQMAAVPGFKQLSTPDNVPSAAKAIELGFGFVSRLLDLQKQYMLKAAEIFVAAQKDAAEKTGHAAEPATSKN